MKKFMNGLGTILLVIGMGILAIVEIVIDVIYYVIRLSRRGYKKLLWTILQKLRTTGKTKNNRVLPANDFDEDIRYFEYYL